MSTEGQCAAAVRAAIARLGLSSPSAGQIAATKQWLFDSGVVTSTLFDAPRLCYILYRICTRIEPTVTWLPGEPLIPGSPELERHVPKTAPLYELLAAYLVLPADGAAADDKGHEASAKRKDQVLLWLAQDAAQLFYSSTRPERFDLFIHMSASEVFFVDGDSLLFEALCNTHVDWTYVQTLHVVFLVEKALQDLLVRGGRLHVVFFDCMAGLTADTPRLAFLRQLLQLHLRSRAKSTGQFTFKTFANWWDRQDSDTSFLDYQERFGAEFMMINDGEQLVSEPRRAQEYSLIADDAAAEGKAREQLFSAERGRRAQEALRTLLFACVANRLHVVYTSGAVCKDNAVVSYVVRANSTRFLPMKGLLPAMERFWRNGGSAQVVQPGEAAAADGGLAALPPFKVTADHIAAMNDIIDAQVIVNARELVTVIALRAVVKKVGATPTTLALCKATLVAALVMRELPLECRAQPTPVPVGSEYATFVEQLCGALADALLIARKSEDVDIHKGLPDIFDAKMLLVVAGILQKSHEGTPLSAKATASAEKMWALIVEKTPLTPLGEGLPLLGAAAAVPSLPSPLRLSTGERHPLLRHLLQTSSGGAASAAGTAAAEASARDDNDDDDAAGGVLEERDWNIQNPLIHMDEPPGLRERERELASLDKSNKRELKRFQRREMNFVASIQATAKSMGEIAFLAANEVACIVDDSRAEAAEREKRKQHHAGQQSKKAPQLSKAEQIKRANIENKANEEMFFEENRFANLLQQNEALRTEGMRRLLRDCRLPYRKLLSGRPETAEEQADQVKVWRRFVDGGKGRTTVESEVVFLRKGQKYTAMEEVAEFVKANADTVFPDATDSDERAAVVRGLFMRGFEGHLHLRASLVVLDGVTGAWRAARDLAISQSSSPTHDDMKVAVDVFRAAQAALSIVERYQLRLKTPDRDKIRKALFLLDFEAAYLSGVDALLKRVEGVGALDVLPEAISASHKKVLNLTAARFQLTLMGHLFDRPRPSDSDTRVPFNPDQWQRELLDIVDRRGSAVVCAPTSAGKTFISYYCMKNVLRHSNHDVVVYVAPTRALINQAVADVYSRFGAKEYDQMDAPGWSVYGCLGGAEYVRQPFKCQALITLPETFESLLLSPIHQEWASRIKYVIFDEIHSIDNGGNGSVWERLLMLVRAPFVALSATLGHTNDLVAWLNRVQSRLAKQGHEGQHLNVSLVPSGGTRIERWSDIEKFAYLPTAVKPFRKLRAGKVDFTDKALLSVHPMSCVTVEMLQTKFPQDLPFVPHESVELYDVMVEVSKTLLHQFRDLDVVRSIKTKLQAMDPNVFFAGMRAITQQTARRYEKALKEEVLRWGQFSAKNWGTLPATLVKEDLKLLNSLGRKLVVDLAGRFNDEVRRQESALASLVEAQIEERKKTGAGSAGSPPSSPSTSAPAAAVPAPAPGATTPAGGTVATGAAVGGGEELQFPDTFDFVQQNMLNALTTLQRQDKLPCIVFSFEEEDCDKLVNHVVSLLERAEAAYRLTDEFKAYVKKIEANAANHAKQVKTMQSYEGKSVTEGEDGKKHEVDHERVEVELTHNFVIPDVLPEFSFATNYSTMSAEEKREIEFDLQRVDDDLPYRAFKRGIGIHHPGVKGKLRIHFERLFRTRYLPVIFATETLALGVHSPCRTVVLAGDHVYLNTMQFRQMSGRAGRRGQDWIGFTVFMGVSFKKIQRLMTSDLPVLKGHLQADAITQLRLQQLHDYNEETDGAGVLQRGGGSASAAGTKFETAEKRRTHAANVANCLLEDPLFVHGRLHTRDFREAQLKHLQVCVELFQREGLMFTDEPPFVSSLGALVSRALNINSEIFAGNAAFTVAALLQRGLFHDITASWGDNDENSRQRALDSLLVVLSYFFSQARSLHLPLEVHPSVLSDPMVFPPSGSPHACKHDVVLRGLRTLGAGGAADKRVLRELQDYNSVVLTLFSQFLAEWGRREREADGNAPARLPLYDEELDGKMFPKKAGSSPIVATLEANRIRFDARSPFIALAGLGDVFESVEDMVHSLRKNLFVDIDQIPTVDFRSLGRHDKTQVLINACAVDFARVRSQTVDRKPRRHFLNVYNGLTASLSWFALSKFTDTIENLCLACETIAPASHHINETEEIENYRRTGRGTWIVCSNPHCLSVPSKIREALSSKTLADMRHPLYKANVIVGPCLTPASTGAAESASSNAATAPTAVFGQTFYCRRCVEDGHADQKTRYAVYVEDRFVSCLQELAANVNEWDAEMFGSTKKAEEQKGRIEKDPLARAIRTRYRNPRRDADHRESTE